MNAGAAQLDALGLSLADVVDRLAMAGFTAHRPAVSRWRNGKRLPEASARKALQEVFGIEPRAWDLPPGAEAPEEATVSPEATQVATITGNTLATALDPTASELAKDLLGRIQVLREQSESTTLPLSARKQLAEMEGRAIERYAKLSGQAATERDILSSPHFTRVLDELMAALEPYPEALRAVRKAMSEADAA